jgi:hypothetical protein
MISRTDPVIDIIRHLKEAKPTRNGKIDEEKLDEIKEEFKNA